MIDCVVLENLSENLFSVLCNRLSDDNLNKIISSFNQGNWIRYVNLPSESVCLSAVLEHGNNIRYISNPSEIVCLAALNQSGYNIQFIENPSEKVLLAAKDFLLKEKVYSAYIKHELIHCERLEEL